MVGKEEEGRAGNKARDDSSDEDRRAVEMPSSLSSDCSRARLGRTVYVISGNTAQMAAVDRIFFSLN